jgi:hypothetical protein
VVATDWLLANRARHFVAEKGHRWMPKESMQAVGRGRLREYHDPQSTAAPQELAMAATTSTAAATPGLIRALDLGQFKTVACAYDPASAQARFHTVTSSRQDLRKLFAQARPAVVVFEACALAGWVLDLCRDAGLAAQVANTASEAWKLKHSKRKTDRDDALRLAQLQALGQLPRVALPAKQTREWRALIAARPTFVGRRVALQNRIRSLLVGQGLPAPRGQRAGTETGLPGIGPHATPLAACGPDERRRGVRDLALTGYRQARDPVAAAEARRDALAAADHLNRQRRHGNRLQTLFGPASSATYCRTASPPQPPAYSVQSRAPPAAARDVRRDHGLGPGSSDPAAQAEPQGSHP